MKYVLVSGGQLYSLNIFTALELTAWPRCDLGNWERNIPRSNEADRRECSLIDGIAVKDNRAQDTSPVIMH